MTTHLTDTQKQTIRIALNEWLGWKPNGAGYWHKDGQVRALRYIPDDGESPWPAIQALHDPVTSLDYCHEIELKLTDGEHRRFRIKLWEVTVGDFSLSYEEQSDKARRAFVSANAEEVSLALFRALNLGELGD